MAETAESMEDGEHPRPDLGILPQSSAPPTDDGGTERETPPSMNGRAEPEPVGKEWLLIRLGHRLCGFRS